jgi:hypothetical protein
MFRFVTIIPLEFWAIVLLLLFMWAAFGLNGFILTVVSLVLINVFGQLRHDRIYGRRRERRRKR